MDAPYYNGSDNRDELAAIEPCELCGKEPCACGGPVGCRDCRSVGMRKCVAVGDDHHEYCVRCFAWRVRHGVLTDPRTRSRIESERGTAR